MYKMSYNEALEIQRAQIAFYRQSIGRKGIKNIRKQTYCPADCNPNEPLSIFIIDKYVPRGYVFETLIKHIPRVWDETSCNWHNAIINGKQ